MSASAKRVEATCADGGHSVGCEALTQQACGGSAMMFQLGQSFAETPHNG